MFQFAKHICNYFLMAESKIFLWYRFERYGGTDWRAMMVQMSHSYHEGILLFGTK
jgi:hypothetical protein